MATTAQKLLLYPADAVVMPPLLFPEARYYAFMARYGHASVDTSMRYDKRLKAAHRFVIADTRGPLSLTIPIVKPDFADRPSWDDVRISRHGQWWDKHMTALESAYGRTPFFEFYIDRLAPLFSRDTTERFDTVGAMISEANRQVCSILGLNPPSRVGDATRIDTSLAGLPTIAPYPQIREASLGFIPGLSILDLIFNLGPEAPLYLRQHALQSKSAN